MDRRREEHEGGARGKASVLAGDRSTDMGGGGEEGLKRRAGGVRVAATGTGEGGAKTAVLAGDAC